MKTKLLAFAVIVTSFSFYASAAILSFSQSIDGTISAVLTTGPCPLGPLPGQATPIVTTTPTEIDISTGSGGISSYFGAVYLCDPQGSPGITVKAPLGKLGDGTYTVVWNYYPKQTKGTFAVVGGALRSIYPTSVSGLWYDPAASGSGFNFEMDANWLLVTYFGWDAAGHRLWLTSDFGPYSLIPNTPITLNMSYTTGGTFSNPQHNVVPWGTLVLNFSSCRSASATLSGKDGTVNLNLTHLTFVGGAPLC